ncbi:Hemoglobin-like protein HbO [Labilithrix luteola]|uniref:Hemoglobin-like protein HbO n=2 Tax=Labilithrix luteola TaxID=1391654 RepID=A0A0K1Q016_9BACT|nr:Hemoglobin-like protein HbO [Labilithrix luteola]
MVPTLLEWMGGIGGLEHLMEVFYTRVAADELLEPVFRSMSPEHAKHVAAFVGEVFGGPKTYSEGYGGHPAMIRHHVGRALSDAQRKRWVTLLLECADEVGAPDDPEFRSAFVAYLEWGSRLAVINSQPEADVTTEAPMPSWGWGEVKGPYTK